MKRCPPPASNLTKSQRAKLSRFPGLRKVGSAAIFNLAHTRAIKRGQMRRYRKRLKEKVLLQSSALFVEVGAKRGKSTPTAPLKGSRNVCTLQPALKSRPTPDFLPRRSVLNDFKKCSVQGLKPTRSSRGWSRSVSKLRIAPKYPARPIPWSSWWED